MLLISNGSQSSIDLMLRKSPHRSFQRRFCPLNAAANDSNQPKKLVQNHVGDSQSIEINKQSPIDMTI